MLDPKSQKAINALQKTFDCCPTLMQHQITEHIQIHEFAANTVFIKQGDKCEGIYIVVDGSVKLYVKNNTKNQVIQFKGNSEAIGLQSAMNRQTFQHYAAAMEDSILTYIPYQQIEKLLTLSPHTFFSLMKKINEQAVMVENHSSLLLTGDAEKTVLNTMHDLKARFGTDPEGYLKVRLSVKDLASYVSISKTTIYRVLQSLREKSLISHHLDRFRFETTAK